MKTNRLRLLLTLQWLKARGGKAYHVSCHGSLLANHELSEAERLAVSQASPRPMSVSTVTHHGRRQIDTTQQKQQPGKIGQPQAAVEQAWARGVQSMPKLGFSPFGRLQSVKLG